MSEVINPIADFAAFMPPNLKGEMFKEEVDEAAWCEFSKKYGHGNCEPWAILTKLLQRMIALDIGQNEMVPGLKGLPMSWRQYPYSKISPLKCDQDGDQTFEPDLGSQEDRARHVCKLMNDLKVSTKGTDRMPDLEVPDIYWDRNAMLYCVKNAFGNWQYEYKENTVERLLLAGISGYAKPGDLSDCYRELLKVRNERVIDLMTPLAGYQAGLYDLNGATVLVDRGFKIIEPDTSTDSRFRHIWGLISGLLVDLSTKDESQVWHFVAHLQNCYRDLVAGRKSGSMAVFLVGPADCGKTVLLKTVVVPLLGDRYADAYLHVSGQSSFNDELIKKEVWLLDDAPAPEDSSARRKLSGMLKQSVAAGHVACHAKGKAQMSLPLYRRLFIALNDDELELLPVFSEALADKFMLLKCQEFKMPKNCMPLPVRDKQAEFEQAIRAELPAFIGWLLRQNLSDYSSRRFGVESIKNAELVSKNEEASGLDLKYAVICQALFKVDRDATDLKASEIYLTVMGSSSNSEAAKSVFRNPKSMGMVLRELKDSVTYGQLVTVRMLDGIQRWTIRQDEDTQERLKARE